MPPWPAPGSSTADAAAHPATSLLSVAENGPGALAADDRYLYWTSYCEGSVHRLSKRGGGDRVIVRGQNHPFAIAVGDKHVYWANRGTMLPSTCWPGDSLCGEIHNPYARDAQLMRADKDGAAVTVLASHLWLPLHLFLDRNYVYLASEDRVLRRVAKRGGPLQVLTGQAIPVAPSGVLIADGGVHRVSQPGSRAPVYGEPMLSDGKRVYGIEKKGFISAVTLGTHQLDILAIDPSLPDPFEMRDTPTWFSSSFAIDNTWLYWTSCGRIRRVPTTGGRVQTIAAEPGFACPSNGFTGRGSPDSLVVDGRYVYWIARADRVSRTECSGGAIRRVARKPRPPAGVEKRAGELAQSAESQGW